MLSTSRRIPSRHDQPPRVRIALDHLDQLRNLIDRLPVLRRPGPPLRAVDRPEVAALVRPLVPNLDAVVLQIAHIGVAASGTTAAHGRSTSGAASWWSRSGNPSRQVEPHLIPEHRERAGARYGRASSRRGLQHVLHQIEILAHRQVPESTSILPVRAHAKGRKPGVPRCFIF